LRNGLEKHSHPDLLGGGGTKTNNDVSGIAARAIFCGDVAFPGKSEQQIDYFLRKKIFFRHHCFCASFSLKLSILKVNRFGMKTFNSTSR
jgi:hypothetical protein